MTVKDDTIRRVAQQAGATLVYVDRDLRVRFANRHCHELLGHAPDTLHGRDLADLVDTATLRCARRQVEEVERGAAAAREYALRHKNGTKKFVQVSAVADRDPSGRSVGYVLSTSDHPGEKAAAAPAPAARRARLEQRARLDRVRRELLTAANHALRTPLASIIAALELMQHDGAAAAQGMPESLLAIALENAGRLAGAVEQWLDMERIEIGAAPMRAVPLKVDALVRGLIAELARPEAAPVRLLSGGAAMRTVADPTRLRRAIAHLIAGAIERSHAAGAVQVTLARQRDSVVLSVEDEASHAAPGADLGQLIAEAVVRRCGGTLRIERRPVKGTLAVIELPHLREEGDV
ncbi:MAG TPA: PAS domain-containing sensor histidine kinase [Burkholderiales bacterium]|nr:PAS domain-containing sensor histidine kinase [Burkholderiales bacterium]